MDAQVIGEKISALRKSRKARTLVLALSVTLLLIFIVSSIFWHHYINAVYAPFLENARLRVVNTEGSSFTSHRYDDRGNGYLIEVVLPPHLQYSGAIQILTLVTSEGDFYGSFNIYHSNIFSGYERAYVLTLGETVETVETNDDGIPAER